METRRTSSLLLGGSISLLLGLSLTSGLLLLDVLRHELLVLGSGLLAGLEALELLSLDELLAAETLLSDETLDLGGLVVSLVTTLDLATHDVLGHIVLLWVETEDGGNLVLSLLEEAVGHLLVGAALDLLLTLLGDLEGDHVKVGSGEASTDGPSCSVTSSSRSEESSLLFEEDASSAVFHDTLLHCESLSVISTSDLEHVAFVVITHDRTVNLLSHSLVKEGADLAFIINLN